MLKENRDYAEFIYDGINRVRIMVKYDEDLSGDAFRKIIELRYKRIKKAEKQGFCLLKRTHVFYWSNKRKHSVKCV